MTLSEIIISYRKKTDLSQRKLAEICELSNGYISMLEKNLNPKNNQPIDPTLSSLNKLAKGMNISLTQLLSEADDIDVSLSDDRNITFLTLTPDPEYQKQKLTTFNKNGIEGAHEVFLPSDDVLNEINKLAKALQPYPAEQINAILKLVENGGNIPIDPELPPELRELVSICSELSPESLQALITVAKTMK